MKIFFLIMIAFHVSCGARKSPGDKGEVQLNQSSFQDEYVSSALIAEDLSFEYFEQLIFEEEDIDFKLFNRFVHTNMDLDPNGTHVIGKGGQVMNSFKVFLFKIGDNKKSWFLTVSFSENNEQIDLAKFLFFCNNCNTSVEVARVHFDYSNKSSFNVDYYMQLMDRSMPIFEDLKYTRKEQWLVTPDGMFKKSK